MKTLTATKHSWLDHVATTLAVICCVHCLVTPVLLVSLPIIATTFWVDENFHLWMLLLVIPSTSFAIWSGCRRHKDKFVIAAAALGLGILSTVLIYERAAHAHYHSNIPKSILHTTLAAHARGEPMVQIAEGGYSIDQDTAEIRGKTNIYAASLTSHAMLNTLGGFFLILGHTRNFLLCRKHKRIYEQTCC